ncbi:ferredoxin [Nakamurella flavida]|uniref:Ferredoxin n=1 Tax=Nakamurella flavida TaxID=363630 RepID=A0A938YMQ8_9ACTN|nr:ferredoxin [Nakamurella flavida]MBM9476044.1 ferredoxin [Nakamurella flavida]MDP9777213.1 ferredoxin [Nakamurella flavida]
MVSRGASVAGRRLEVDPLRCRAHGLCADEFGEGITLDEWGYPLLPSGPVPAELIRRARAAANACPVLALRLQRVDER